MVHGAARLSFIGGESLLKRRVGEGTQIENQQHSVRTARALADSFRGRLSIIRIAVINQMQRGIMTTGTVGTVSRSANQRHIEKHSAKPVLATYCNVFPPSFLISLRRSTLGTDRAAWLGNDVERFIEIDSSLESEA